MTTKKPLEPLNLTAEEYKERYNPFVLAMLLEEADSRDPKSLHFEQILREMPKIRKALGRKTLTTTEIRERYAHRYATNQSDIDAGRAEFDAWLAAYTFGLAADPGLFDNDFPEW